MNAGNGLDIGLLTQPYYAFSESDYIADVSRGTSRRWIAGYTYRDASGPRVQRPPVTKRRDHSRAEDVSWIDLIEIIAIGRLKNYGFSLRRIRDIVETCQQLLEEPHPLVTQKFKTDGREIFLSLGERLLDVSRRSRRGMVAWDRVLSPFLDTLDYEHEIARRWWPMGKQTRVVVDPDYGFGYPVVFGTGVRTELIAERFRVGEPAREIAEDFNITSDLVEDALRFELERRAA